MAFLLTLIFFAWFISAIVRGRFSYQNNEYSFKEHPIQFIIVMACILGVALFCLNKFLNDIGIRIL